MPAKKKDKQTNLQQQQQQQKQKQDDAQQQRQHQPRDTTTPVLEQPAVLFHIFKFAAKDVRRLLQLSYVTTSFNNTICYHMPKLWADIAKVEAPHRLLPRFIEACESGRIGHLHALTPLVDEAALSRGLLRCLDLNCVREIISTIKSNQPERLPSVIGQFVKDISNVRGLGAVCRLPREDLVVCVFEGAGKPRMLTSQQKDDFVECLDEALYVHAKNHFHTGDSDEFESNFCDLVMNPSLAFAAPLPQGDLDQLLITAAVEGCGPECEALLRAGADPNASDGNLTAVQYLSGSGLHPKYLFEAAHVFIRYGADVSSCGEIKNVMRTQHVRHVAWRRSRADDELSDDEDKETVFMSTDSDCDDDAAKTKPYQDGDDTD